MQTALDDVLNGRDQETEQETQTEEIIQDPVMDEVKPTGETEQPKEAQATPPVGNTNEIEELQKQIAAFQRKAQDEKFKRQQLEQRLQASASPQEKVSVFDDEDAAIQQRVQPMLTDQQRKFNGLSEDFARRMHKDYDDKFNVFEELAMKDPSLIMQLNQSVNPAMFAYDKATEYLNMQQIKSVDNIAEVTQLSQLLKESGGLDGFRAKLADQIKKELAESALNSAVANQSPSLASATGAGGTTSRGFVGSTPLDQIIGEKAR